MERPLIGENQDRLGAFFFQAGFSIDAQQRHKLIAILHEMAAVGDFDAAAIDLFEPGDQRERHGLRPLRAGAEYQQRNRIFAGDLLALLRFGGLGLGGLRGAAERLGDAVRIEDHDHRAVAENGGAGETPQCAAASTTSA